VFIGSGVRYDLLVGRTEEDRRRDHLDAYTRQLVRRHVSGRLKVAPEHTSARVLRMMRKPSFGMFEAFKKRFEDISRKAGLKQLLVPYFISAHPGCTRQDMADLARHTRRLGYRLEQVQEFTPAPMTLATAIYYSGMHPYNLRPVYSARSRAERAEQHRLFFGTKNQDRSGGRTRLGNSGGKRGTEERRKRSSQPRRKA
jgi:uncharacterized radical SAM protein YgiQ